MCYLITAAACAVLAPRAAHAYRTAGDLPALQSETPVTWSPVGTVAFDLAGELPDSVTQKAFDLGFHNGAAAWAVTNCVGPSPLLTWVPRDEHVSDDGVNTIGFVASDELPGGVPRDTPAVTELQYERDADGHWRIIEADLYLNADREWSGVEEDSVDLATVIAHELGHVVGLLHPCELSGAHGAPECEGERADSLMFPQYDAADATLSEDDVLGYCYLYPEARCNVGERGCAPFIPEISCDAGVEGCEDASVPDASIVEPEDDVACDGGACACEADVDAGADPGACVRDLEFASPCMSSAECASGLCVGESSSDATCTRACGDDDGPCPSGFHCAAVNGRNVCVGPSADGSSGCSVAKVSSLSSFSWRMALMAALLALIFHSSARRRRRCVSHKN